MIARANRPSSLVDWVDAPPAPPPSLRGRPPSELGSWRWRTTHAAHRPGASSHRNRHRLEEAMEGGRVLGEWPSGDRLPHFRAAQLTSPQGFSGQTIPCKPGQMGSLFRLPLLKGTRTFTVQGAVIAVIIVVKDLSFRGCVLEGGSAAAAAVHHSRGHVHCKPSTQSHQKAAEERPRIGNSQGHHWLLPRQTVSGKGRPLRTKRRNETD